VLLEFVRWEIGNKKGPENEGLVRSLHAFSGRVRSTQSLSGGWAAHSCFGARICDGVHHRLLTLCVPSYPFIKWASRNTRTVVNNVEILERETDLSAVNQAYEETDPAESFRQYLALAEKGSVWSMATVGWMLQTGTGTE
jgi:hypothetical protein